MKKIYISRENRDLMYHQDKDIWFEKVEDKIYTIKCNLDYILQYASINYDSLPEDAEDYDFSYTDQNNISHKCLIHSFDPSGGPYISINNYEIEGKKVVRIFERDKEMYFRVE